jgi:hypothetical protein
MKKKVLFLFVCFAYQALYAVTGFTYNWTINLTGDTATVTKWKANNDSVLNWSARIGDTVNTKVNWANTAKDSTYWRVARFVKIKTDSTITVDSANIRALKITGAISFPTRKLFDVIIQDTLLSASGGLVHVTMPSGLDTSNAIPYLMFWSFYSPAAGQWSWGGNIITGFDFEASNRLGITHAAGANYNGKPLRIFYLKYK